MGRVGMETVNRLIWGLFLIAVGALLLAANLGVELPYGVWNYWPFLLIVMGGARMLFGAEGALCGDGLWLLLAGLYGAISIWHVWGLSWGTAWPIFVIAGGLSLLFQPGRDRKGRSAGDPAAAQGVDRVG